METTGVGSQLVHIHKTHSKYAYETDKPHVISKSYYCFKSNLSIVLKANNIREILEHSQSLKIVYVPQTFLVIQTAVLAKI